MTNSETAENALERQIEMLRSVTAANSASRVQDGITKITRLKQQRVFYASLGAAVSVFATSYFAFQGDPFSYSVLGLVSVVMIWTALKSSREASTLARLRSGASLLTSWRAEIRQQLRQTLISPVLTLTFAVLTGSVVLRHGMFDFRSFLFLATSAGLLVFVVYQLLVVRPALRRELALLNPDE